MLRVMAALEECRQNRDEDLLVRKEGREEGEVAEGEKRVWRDEGRKRGRREM